MIRLLWLWVSILLIVFTTLGVGTYHLWQRQALQGHLEVQERLVAQASLTFSREMGLVDQIIRFLKSQEEQLAPTKFPNQAAWRAEVMGQFERFYLISNHISQLRWLSQDGQELVRSDVQHGQMRPIPESQLQTKANRYYYQQGMQTPYDDVFLSPIDLNVEHGEVVVPYEATLRAVTKLRSDTGEALGLLVLNYKLNNLLDRLQDVAVSPYTLEMMNAQGQWLISQNPNDAWQHMFGEYLGSFPNRYPNAWSNLKANHQALQRVYLDHSAPAIIQPAHLTEDRESTAEYYYILSTLEPGVWHRESVRRAWATAAVSLFSYLVLLLLSYFLWQYWQQRQHYVKRIEQDKAKLDGMYQSLTKANADLVTLQGELVEQSKMSALGMMVAGVGHELNTPLGGLRMSLSTMPHIVKQVAKKEPEKAEILQETIEIANQNLTRAIDIVAQFKRMTQQRIHQDKVSFNVHDTVDDMLSPLKQIFKQHPYIKIRNQVPDELVWVSSPGALSQALQNLIMNALEHAFESNQSGEITITASIEDEYVVEIADNGCGIPDEMIETIWTPFVTTGRGQRHTGLGLYMVYQWVHHLLGGTVAAKSSPEGTRFTISVPIIKLPPSH